MRTSVVLRRFGLAFLAAGLIMTSYSRIWPAMGAYGYTTVGILVGLVAGLLTAIGILSEGRESRFVVVVGSHGNALMIGTALASLVLGVVAGLVWPAVLATGAAYWITRPSAHADEADDA